MLIVFQDPYGSLDPRKRVEDAIGDVLDIHGLAPRAARRERPTLAAVGDAHQVACIRVNEIPAAVQPDVRSP